MPHSRWPRPGGGGGGGGGAQLVRIHAAQLPAPGPPAASFTLDVPLTQVYSLRKFVPTLGISFLIITRRSGEACWPLYFHEGYRALNDFVHSLGNFASITRYCPDGPAAAPGVYVR